MKRISPEMLVEVLEGFTKGKTAEIEYFDKKANKWKVNYDEQWCGWLTSEELKIIRD